MNHFIPFPLPFAYAGARRKEVGVKAAERETGNGWLRCPPMNRTEIFEPTHLCGRLAREIEEERCHDRDQCPFAIVRYKTQVG